MNIKEKNHKSFAKIVHLALRSSNLYLLFEHHEARQMNTISIALSEQRLSRLEEKASALGMTKEELVILSIDDMLRHPDEEFKRLVDEIMEENAELYRRLA